MASIEQLQTELNDAVAAIAELRQATTTEKQEIANKLTALDTKITEQTGLIEQLQQQIAQGTIPDSLVSELANLNASIRSTTNEIKNIVETPVN
ncbi:MAG: hypothetical protein C6Y22_30650 [Hapalosiphonaceae cyanobacterium JJU2]|nr:MAG: hypothetical protein C6Y22_30650 [Hapalosiphonaceae cyanobacterium JJU2]